MAPNQIPTLESNAGVLTSVEWLLDSDWNLRTTITEPRRVQFLLRVVPATGSTLTSFRGGVRIQASNFETATGARVGGDANINCGSGNFSFDPRDAGCAGVRFDPAARTVTFTNVNFSSSLGGPSPITLNGTYKWADISAKPGTTVTKAQLAACPASAFSELNPPWSGASCLNGKYIGTSETGGSCEVNINSAASQLTYTNGTYTQTATRYHTRGYVAASGGAAGSKIWAHSMGIGNALLDDFVTMRFVSVSGNAGAEGYSPNGVSPMRVRFQALRINLNPSAARPLGLHTCDLQFD